MGAAVAVALAISLTAGFTMVGTALADEDDFSDLDPNTGQWSFGYDYDAETVFVLNKYAPKTVDLPDANFGVWPYTYSITPNLPDGITLNGWGDLEMSLDADASAATGYTLTTTDANGQTANLTISIEVSDALSWHYAYNDSTLWTSRTFIVGQPNQTSLPQARAGSGTITYSISPTITKRNDDSGRTWVDNDIWFRQWPKVGNYWGVAALTSSDTTKVAETRTYTLTASNDPDSTDDDITVDITVTVREPSGGL